MKQNIGTWFKNISIKNKLYFIAGVMFCLILLELVTLYTMVYLLSAGRAYVGGEGLWSKAEKDATIYLLKYANSRDEKDYQKYLSFINVTLGDKKARIELQKPNPNLNVAYQGFLEGRNLPADIPRMIKLFYWFQYTYYLRKAAQQWVEADSVYIPRLQKLADQLHQQILNNTLTPAEHEKYVNDIYQINSNITIFADNFSYALGDASRWLEQIVLRTLLTIAITVELSGVLLTVLITFRIRKGIDEIIRVSNKVKQLDFSDRAVIYSQDEIGQLAAAFNQMITDLKISIDSQNKEITERKKQEKRLSVRYEITRVMVEYFTLEEAIPKIIQIMCALMNLQYGGFWKIDTANKNIRCANTWTTDNQKIKEFAAHSREVHLTFGSALPGKVWQIKQPYWIQDISQESNFVRLRRAEGAGLRSAFAIPILFEDEVQGVLEFFSDHIYQTDNSLLQMLNDISNLLGIFIQREHAQKRVASLSRLAGMAEVASNVLHNIGNTLNSINTSIALMTEKTTHSKISAIVELDKLFLEHQHDLASFLQEDAKGKYVPQFISLLSTEWLNENKFFTDELSALSKNVLHVNNIIMMQQSYSRTVGVTDKVEVTELFEEAIELNQFIYQREAIKIIKEYSPVKQISTNKEKLFQIVVNLVKNAIDALVLSKKKNKSILLRLREKDDSHFMIQVIDNGVGILSENITKIFSHGFTTKEYGHGFGLHSCALYANEMGGVLYAESPGIDQGATFTLILPYRLNSRKEPTTESDNES